MLIHSWGSNQPWKTLSKLILAVLHNVIWKGHDCRSTWKPTCSQCWDNTFNCFLIQWVCLMAMLVSCMRHIELVFCLSPSYETRRCQSFVPDHFFPSSFLRGWDNERAQQSLSELVAAKFAQVKHHSAGVSSESIPREWTDDGRLRREGSAHIFAGRAHSDSFH